MYIFYNAGFFSCTNTHRYVGNILYKYKRNCCACSDPFPSPPPRAFPGYSNSCKLHLCWLKQMLSYGNSTDFQTSLCLFAFHRKSLPPIREPSCSVSGKLLKIQQILSRWQPSYWWLCCSTAPTYPFWILNDLSGWSSCVVYSNVMECYRITLSGVLRQETKNLKKQIHCF